MGNCVGKLRGKSDRLTITLLALGLDNAGKTTILQGVKGELASEVAPTIGFESYDLQTKDFNIKVYDLGGGARIRGIWQNYFSETHGVIYVVDSSDLERMEECRVMFDKIVSDDCIRGKPILILANKQDKPEAIDELELCTRMKLDEVVNRNECYSKVVLCSALPSHGRRAPKKLKLDRGIKNGYLWLLDMIKQSYDTLQNRVDRDVGEQKKREADEKALKIERVRQRREERERQQKIMEEQSTIDDRPQPEGISCQELQNDYSHAVVTSEGNVLSNGMLEENVSATGARTDADISPATMDTGNAIETQRSKPNYIEVDTVKHNNVEENVPPTAESTLPGAISTPNMADANLNSSEFYAVQHDNETPEHPRALSTASLKELVRDTPTPTKLHGTDSTLNAVPLELDPALAKPESVVSLRKQDDESGSMSSVNVDRKRKKKRKHKKKNKIEPGNSDDSEMLQGKLAPIRNPLDADSAAGYGKLPPIRANPNYSSDVEL